MLIYDSNQSQIVIPFYRMISGSIIMKIYSKCFIYLILKEESSSSLILPIIQPPENYHLSQSVIKYPSSHACIL